VKILKRKVAHNTVILTIQTFAAGTIRCSGKNLKTVSRRVGKASVTRVKIPFSSGALRALRQHRKLRVRVRVSFAPAQRGVPRSSAATTVTLH
jgi:hypothetical protein